jgi:hypothetical protein
MKETGTLFPLLLTLFINADRIPNDAAQPAGHQDASRDDLEAASYSCVQIKRFPNLVTVRIPPISMVLCLNCNVALEYPSGSTQGDLLSQLNRVSDRQASIGRINSLLDILLPINCEY